MPCIAVSQVASESGYLDLLVAVIRIYRDNGTELERIIINYLISGALHQGSRHLGHRIGSQIVVVDINSA